MKLTTVAASILVTLAGTVSAAKCYPRSAFAYNYCGGSYGDLQWNFYATKFCNEGMIGSSWWEATGKKFGSIDC